MMQEPKDTDRDPAGGDSSAEAPAPPVAPEQPPEEAERPTIDPRPGQMVDFAVTTSDPVFRFSTRQPLVSGEPICWNDYYFHLWRSGCIRPLALAEPAHG